MRVEVLPEDKTEKILFCVENLPSSHPVLAKLKHNMTCTVLRHPLNNIFQ